VFVIFDLDGTVWDSARGIVGCLRECFEHHGLVAPSVAASRAVLGPPLRDMLAELGMPDEVLDPAVIDYRERYSEWGAFEADLYDGMVDVLDRLIADGHRLATATSKGEVGTALMIDHFGLRDRFEVIGASSMDGITTTKSAVISRTLEGLGNPDPDDCLMVGDRRHDVEGAAAHHIRCVGVSWGYGSVEELVDAGATAIAERPADVPPLVGRK
jgi:phosphoglycolate phosphatase